MLLKKRFEQIGCNNQIKLKKKKKKLMLKIIKNKKKVTTKYLQVNQKKNQ